jgi:hypothetical protein
MKTTHQIIEAAVLNRTNDEIRQAIQIYQEVKKQWGLTHEQQEYYYALKKELRIRENQYIKGL